MVENAPALGAAAGSTRIETPGFYARGYPYECRNPVDSVVEETTATGDVMINMGVWDNILDLNGIDKLQAERAVRPGAARDRATTSRSATSRCAA